MELVSSIPGWLHFIPEISPVLREVTALNKREVYRWCFRSSQKFYPVWEQPSSWNWWCSARAFGTTAIPTPAVPEEQTTQEFCFSLWFFWIILTITARANKVRPSPVLCFPWLQVVHHLSRVQLCWFPQEPQSHIQAQGRSPCLQGEGTQGTSSSSGCQRRLWHHLPEGNCSSNAALSLVSMAERSLDNP